MSRGDAQRKVTPEQRDELFRLWQSGEFAAMFKMQKDLGVERKYTAKRAYDARVKRGRPVGNYNDPRWQWAIERGAVLA